MTTPTRDDLALYAIGHYDGDASALERRLDADPALASQLADEADFAALLRAAAREAMFCSRCHDLVEGERCACEKARPARRPVWTFAIAAATLAAAVAIVLATRHREDDHRPETATLPVGPRIDAPPLAPPAPPALIDQPAAPPVEKKPPAPTRSISKLVTLKIVTKPAGVVALLNGTHHGMTPLTLRVPRSTTPAVLSLQHIGYRPQTKQLTLSSDVTVTVSLEPTGAPPPHQGRYTDEQCMQCHRANR